MNEKPLALPRLLLLSAVVAVTALVPSNAAIADSDVVSPDGTLYEVYPARLSEAIPEKAGTPDSGLPVLALRITPSGAHSRVEVVDGTVDPEPEGSASVEFEESTGTLFVAYTKSQGLMTDMHVAVRRNAEWLGRDILPTRGLYLSINPKVVVTRQQYRDFDREGNAVTKSRSIFSLVWWEESGVMSQARFSAIFIEDGELRLDAVQAWNLNELAGSAGVTDSRGLPLSSFSYPAVQADPTTNGGVLVTFANLAARAQQVLRITFLDDLVKLSPPGAARVPDDVWARAHVPIGRIAGEGRIPAVMDTLREVTAVASQKGATTFSWIDGTSMSFVRSDDAEGVQPRRLALREDFSAEKALRLIRTLAEKY